MLRRLHPDQPAGFEFTPANLEWARRELHKYPDGRQGSAILALLWRAQEQEGWLSRPAIEYVADFLGMERIRALEVATFYYMYHLSPMGSVAHVTVCGTTSCMICGAEDLIGVCREKIAEEPLTRSPDGRFSWEEVECLGACANAPMVQIGKDYYEDLTAERFGEILDAFAAGEVPVPGSQTGRFASEPAGGLTSLTSTVEKDAPEVNVSVAIATALGDTISRIDGSGIPPGRAERSEAKRDVNAGRKQTEARLSGDHPVDDTGIDTREAPITGSGHPDSSAPGEAAEIGTRPEMLTEPARGGADDLKRLHGVGPALEEQLHEAGVFHFGQIAGWSDAEIDWIEHNLSGVGQRVRRDEWVTQAKSLLDESETGDDGADRKG